MSPLLFIDISLQEKNETFQIFVKILYVFESWNNEQTIRIIGNEMGLNKIRKK